MHGIPTTMQIRGVFGHHCNPGSIPPQLYLKINESCGLKRNKLCVKTEVRMELEETSKIETN